MLLSDTIVDFHLFYDWAVDIQIWALLTRSQCKVSDTQVTVKACGPLVFILSTMRTIFTKLGTKHSWMKENQNCSILFQGEIIAKIVRIHLFIRKSSSPEPLDQFQSNWGEKIIIMRVQFCPNEMLHIFRKGFNAENKLTTFKNLLHPWEPSLS